VLLFAASNMSAVLDNVVVSVPPLDTAASAAAVQDATSTPPVEVKTSTKTKKPVLPAKLGKFLVFGYAFVCDLQASGVLTEELAERGFDLLRVFASVEEQTLYYQNFLDQSTATAKLLRKFVAIRSKPPKPLKNKKNTTAEGGAPRASKPRAKKSVRVVSDAANDLIGQIVAAANADLPLDTTVTEEGAVEVKAKKPRAPRKPKTVVAETAAADPIPLAQPATAEEPVVSNEIVTEQSTMEQEVKAKKPRAPRKPKTTVATSNEPIVYNEVVTEQSTVEEVKAKKPRAPRKSQTVTAPAPAAVETVVEPLVVEPPSLPPSTPILPEEHQDDDDGSINATEFIYNGVQYLIDDEYNVYSNDTQEIVGIYDPVSKTLTPNDA
jgi:hypothetical protein